MGGWNEEVYYSQFRVALICGILNDPPQETIHEFMSAFSIRPVRAEPLVEVSKIYRSLEKPAAAYVFAKQAVELPYPKEDILFISEDVYSYGALDEISATAYYAGHALEGYNATKKILEDKLIPEPHLERVKKNFEQYQNVMQQIQAQKMQQNMSQQIDKMKEKKEQKTQTTKYKKKKATSR